MSQESAAWVIQGLFLRSPAASQQFCLKFLQHDPSIIDKLFKAAAFKRPPWYAESAVDGIVCETIIMLFRVPDLVIPGLTTKIDDEGLQKEVEEEWQSVMECVEILVSRPKWVELIHGVWNMIEDEDCNAVKRCLIIVDSSPLNLTSGCS